jgi:hypothetical protein
VVAASAAQEPSTSVRTHAFGNDASAHEPAGLAFQIARQPIFDPKLKVEAYELLYRGAPPVGSGNSEASADEGSR